MKMRWSIPQRPVRITSSITPPVTEDENTQGNKVTKPVKAKTTRAKKQEK